MSEKSKQKNQDSLKLAERSFIGPLPQTVSCQNLAPGKSFLLCSMSWKINAFSSATLQTLHN